MTAAASSCDRCGAVMEFRRGRRVWICAGCGYKRPYVGAIDSAVRQRGFVYALADPVSHEIRYIGQTLRTPEMRLVDHVQECLSQKRLNDKDVWIYRLNRRRLVPVLHILEVVESGDRDQAEREWIAAYRKAGAQLFNVSSGGGQIVGLERKVRGARQQAGNQSSPLGQRKVKQVPVFMHVHTYVSGSRSQGANGYWIIDPRPGVPALSVLQQSTGTHAAGAERDPGRIACDITLDALRFLYRARYRGAVVIYDVNGSLTDLDEEVRARLRHAASFFASVRTSAAGRRRH